MRRAGIPDTRLDFVANRRPHLLSGVFRFERNARFVSKLPDAAGFRVPLDVHIDHGTGFACLTWGSPNCPCTWPMGWYAPCDPYCQSALTEPDRTDDGTENQNREEQRASDRFPYARRLFPKHGTYIRTGTALPVPRESAERFFPYTGTSQAAAGAGPVHPGFAPCSRGRGQDPDSCRILGD